MMTFSKDAVPVLRQMDDCEIDEFWATMQEQRQKRERSGRHFDAFLIGGVILLFIVMLILVPDLPR